MSALKLVTVNGSRVHHKRPVLTDYAGAGRYAHSTTVEAAVRSAIRRILKGDYARAGVYSGGRLVVQVQKAPNRKSIVIQAMRGVKL